MTQAELKLECGKHRTTLIRIMKQEDGCLAQTYQHIAQEALKNAAVRSESAAATRPLARGKEVSQEEV